MTYTLGEKKDGKIVASFKLDGKEWDADIERLTKKIKENINSLALDKAKFQERFSRKLMANSCFMKML